MTANKSIDAIIANAISESLSELDLSDKNLTSLPMQIFQIASIKSLIARNNSISSLPNELLSMDLLKLDLRGNPIPIPKEILEKTTQPKLLLNYYFSLSQPTKRHLNEAKLIVVGQGSVGKTSIVRRLISGAFDPSKSKTESISINHWSLSDQTEPEDSQSNIQVNIWDFGGQEIMHATHQFFLTKRSLYLLVLDSRLTQEENRVEYWLKIIQSFGGESPILIVGNKIDQHAFDIDRTGLQKKYPNIVGILETSAATGAGIENLKTAIIEQVNNLPHIRDLLPESWFTVKTKLEKLGRQSNFITHDKYIDLCIENDVSDETSQRILIGFLHDIGVILHFQDDARLESLGILNPQWVTNGVYKILNSHALFKNKGVLTVSMLDEILNLPEYPRSKRLFIVDMMKKFELCYDIESDSTFLVPDLLPKDEPFELRFLGTPAFEYAYPVLPSSVMTRFIVRMNQKIHDGLVWRTGVLLRIGENKALVKADIEDRKINIAIDGLEHTRRDALSAIRYQLDEIHASIKGLDAKKRIPIPGTSNAEPIEYDYLLMLERAGNETVSVKDNNRLITLNVRQILSGIESESQRKQAGFISGNVTNIYISGETQQSNIIAGDSNAIAVDEQPDLLESPTFVWNAVKDSLAKNNTQDFYINSNRLIRLLCEGVSIKITNENMGTDFVYGVLADSDDTMSQLRLQQQFPVIVVGEVKQQFSKVVESTNLFISKIKDGINFDDKTALTFGVFIFMDDSAESDDLLTQASLTSLVIINKSKYEKIIRSSSPLKAFTEEVIHQVGRAKLNPYIYSGPIPYRIFYGREQEQQIVEKNINSSNYAVIANRRMGKTSFLFRISDKLKASYKDNTVVYLDLQHVFTYADFYKQIVSWIAKPQNEGVPEEHDIPTFLSINLLKMLRGNQSFGRIIMIMDEVDELLNYDCKHREKLFRVFRSLSQTQNIRFVFSGTNILVDRRNSPDSPFFNFCEEIIIGRLQKVPSEALITEPMSRLGIKFSDQTDLIQKILEFTDRHPTLIQYLCAKLVDKAFNEEKTNLQTKDLSAILETQSNIDEVFSIIWGDIKSDEKMIIYLTWYFESFSKLDLMQLLKARNLSLDNLDNKLRRLQYYSLLKVEKDRYKFSYKAFAKHFEVFHDIEELVEIEKINMEPKSFFARLLSAFSKQTRES